jgi:hypothetical protein
VPVINFILIILDKKLGKFDKCNSDMAMQKKSVIISAGTSHRSSLPSVQVEMVFFLRQSSNQLQMLDLYVLGAREKIIVRINRLKKYHAQRD